MTARLAFIRRVQSASANAADIGTTQQELLKRVLQMFPETFSRDWCRSLTAELLAPENENRWQTKRHSAFPTWDWPVDDFRPKFGQEIWSLVSDRLSLFSEIPEDQLAVLDMFFVRYCARPAESGQQMDCSQLPWHTDGSLISFQILLNSGEDFTGGGTAFRLHPAAANSNYNDDDNSTTIIKPEQGDLVVHASKVLHSGRRISDGVRLILVGFVDTTDVVRIKRQLMAMSSERHGKSETNEIR